MDIVSLETILTSNNINTTQWESIKTTQRFQSALEEATALWNSALTTTERLKIKSAAALEEWIPELYARMHDGRESLAAKVEAGKLLARISGADSKKDENANAAERFSITINLGADKEIRIDKPVVTSQVIEATVVQES